MNVPSEQNAIRIMEIIRHVVNELSMAKRVEDIDLQALRSEGYSEEEISTAVDLLAQHMQVPTLDMPIRELIPEAQSTSLRMLHPAERRLFSNEAYGELVSMQSQGTLSHTHVEAIIEHLILTSRTQVTKDYFHRLVHDLMHTEMTMKNSSKTVSLLNQTIH